MGSVSHYIADLCDAMGPSAIMDNAYSRAIAPSTAFTSSFVTVQLSSVQNKLVPLPSGPSPAPQIPPRKENLKLPVYGKYKIKSYPVETLARLRVTPTNVVFASSPLRIPSSPASLFLFELPSNTSKRTLFLLGDVVLLSRF